MMKKLQASLVIALCLSAGCKYPWSKAKTEEHTHQETQKSASVQESLIKSIANKTEFEEVVLKSSKLVVVDFYATWCGPCKTMAPIYNELAEQFKDKHVFAKLNVDEAKDVPGMYGIEGVPSFLFFKDGKEIKEKRIVGGVNKSKFEATITELEK